jgi:hypothetical protein
MRTTRTKAALAILTLSTVISSYAAVCYVAGSCTCAVIGQCYSQKVLPNCQVPTCIVADSSASAWNVCPGDGPYTGREFVAAPESCCPASCRAYDACAQQYVSLSGGACCFSIARYEGVGSNCQ